MATPRVASRPRWSGAGDELFFVCGGQVYATSVSDDGRAAAPEALFPVPGAPWWSTGFDVDEEGNFLGFRGSGDATAATIVLNWPRLLEASR